MLGGSSAALLALVLLGPALPESIAWWTAYATVLAGILALLILGWVVLSLPPGAPIRTRGLRGAGAAAALALGVVILRTGLAG